VSFDHGLADRIRRALARRKDVTEKKMFGGLAFLRNGRMFCGVVTDRLMVRVGPERYEEALARPYVRPMDFTGRPMKGYVFVEPAGCTREEDVAEWVRCGVSVVSKLESAPQRRTPKR
jgi:TfoX/Sxy family transcriptional regulator of competence genes